MLTLESKFSDFIELCISKGACSQEGGAVPWMQAVAKTGVTTFGDALLVYAKDEKIPEGWNSWVLEKLGKDLDDKCRQFFIDKIKTEMSALQLRISCDCFTATEHATLLSKYEGKLPTAEKEIIEGKVTLMSATAAVK